MESDREAHLLDVVRRAKETYGTAEVSASGVDISQLRRNRRLSPDERLDQMVQAARILMDLQGQLRRPSS